MKVGVTGATGHIGFVICKQLIELDKEVVAFVRKKVKRLEKLNIPLVTGDINNTDNLDVFIRQCDIIIHTAAEIGLGYKPDQSLYETNVIGTKNVLDLCVKHNVKKVVCFSSIHAFKQFPYDVPLNELRSLVDNNSIYYDQTKREVYVLAQDYAKKGLNITTLAPTSVLGAPDYRPSKIGKAIMDIYKGKIPMMMKGGFDFVDVQDIAQAAISAIDKGRSGEIYILGGKYYTIKELSDIILKIKGVKRRLIVVPEFFVLFGLPFVQTYSKITKRPPLYDKVYLDILKDGNQKIDSSKAKHDLNFQTRSLNDSIKSYIVWFNQNKESSYGINN